MQERRDLTEVQAQTFFADFSHCAERAQAQALHSGSHGGIVRPEKFYSGIGERNSA